MSDLRTIDDAADAARGDTDLEAVDGQSQPDGPASGAVGRDDGALDERRSGFWERRTLPELVVASMVVLWTSYFTQRSLDIHHGLGTASYDSALYDQGMWLLSRGEAPFVTLMGRNLIGDHTSFILFFLVPLYWVAPGAWIMFFAQSAAIGAGAVPVYLYARSRLGSEWFAIVPSAVYLLHPAVGWTNLENFHPDGFLGVLLGFAIYAALERRWRLYAAFVVLSLLVKEDVSLVVVPLGIWVALRRDRRIGLLTVFGALSFMFVAMFVVMRGLIGVPTRNTWRIPFGGPIGLIETSLRHPTQLLSHLRSDGRPWYLWQMTASVGLAFLRLPSVALIAALVLFTNVLSTFWYQYQVEYHYGLVAVPALVIGSVHAIGAWRERVTVRRLASDGTERHVVMPARGLAVAGVALAALCTSFMWSPVPWGRTALYHGQPDNVYAVAMRELIAEIPEDASVAAHYRVTPHIAYRTEIYQFPTPFRAVLYGADDSIAGTRLDDRAEGVEYVMLPTSADDGLTADWAVVASAFDEVAANRYWVLFQRDPKRPLPDP